MTGVIDVGGGMRDIYGAGVFDRCIEDDVNFDCCIGVSAGSANLSSFLAKQKGRTYRFYNGYAFRKEYMSVGNFRKLGSYIDFNYVYGTLSGDKGEDALDYSVMSSYGGKYIIVGTEAHSGKPYYFDSSDMCLNNYDPIKASCSIPLVCRPWQINGVEYYDGGVADPVPLEKAIDEGCDKIVLILTRPKSFRMKMGKESVASKLISKKYPNTARALDDRAKNYNNAVEKAIDMEKQGKCLIVAPDDCCGIDTLTKNKKKLHLLYLKGYNDGALIKEFLKK